jgi:uncharacterized protein YdhG (YjbR/CyaY superfamily)
VTDERDLEGVLDVLGKSHARQILILAWRTPQTAQELADKCETSLPTIYRRVGELTEYGLLIKDTKFDPAGNHYARFETSMDEVCFHLEDDGITVEVEVETDLFDQFGELWKDLERYHSENK